MRVMVVVPSFAKRQQRDPPTVARIVAGFEPRLPPQMRGGIDQPGSVEGQGQTEEYSPQHYAPTSEHKEHQPQHDQRDVIEAVKPDVVAILDQIRSVALDRGVIVIMRGAAQNPTDVRPPAAIARRMRVAGLVSVRMMDAMRRNPLNRATLDRQHAAGYEEIFDQFRHFVTTMSDQPVKAHADTKTAGHPVKNDCADHRRPAPEKESCDRGRMGDNEESPSAPVDVQALPSRKNFITRFVIHQNRLSSNLFR